MVGADVDFVILRKRDRKKSFRRKFAGIQPIKDQLFISQIAGCRKYLAAPNAGFRDGGIRPSIKGGSVNEVIEDSDRSDIEGKKLSRSGRRAAGINHKHPAAVSRREDIAVRIKIKGRSSGGQRRERLGTAAAGANFEKIAEAAVQIKLHARADVHFNRLRKVGPGEFGFLALWRYL